MILSVKNYCIISSKTFSLSSIKSALRRWSLEYKQLQFSWFNVEYIIHFDVIIALSIVISFIVWTVTGTFDFQAGILIFSIGTWWDVYVNFCTYYSHLFTVITPTIDAKIMYLTFNDVLIQYQDFTTDHFTRTLQGERDIPTNLPSCSIRFSSPINHTRLRSSYIYIYKKLIFEVSIISLFKYTLIPLCKRSDLFWRGIYSWQRDCGTLETCQRLW